MVNVENPVESMNSRGRSRRKLAVGVTAGVVLLLAAGVGGYAYASYNVNRGVVSAQEYANTVDRTLTASLNEARSLAENTTADMLDDPSLLGKLNTVIAAGEREAGVKEVGGNRWLVWTLLDSEHAYDEDSHSANTAINRIKKQATAISDNVTVKRLADTKASLQSTIDAAVQTLKNTSGKVTDDSTRETLQNVIDEANRIINDKAVTVDELNTAKNNIDNAVKTVNDSKAAKEQADAQTASQSSSSVGNGTSNGYAGGGYSGGGYTNNYGSAGGGYTGGGYSAGGTGGGSGWSPEVGDSVTDHGGIWYGGQMQNGVMGYTESGLPVTPFDPDTPNSWTTGPMPVG